MEKKKASTVSCAVYNGVREGYEAKVALESLERAGNNPNLKGVVHEVLYRDLLNASPTNLLNGREAVLTRAANAVRDDVLLKEGGKVVGRFQLKDTVGSVGKTVKQAASGKYAGTSLVGTTETAQAYRGAVNRLADRGVKVTQKMHSSGVSSTTTARVADKALGKLPGTEVLLKSAQTAAAGGALLASGVEVLASGRKFLDGELSGAEYAGKVAKAGVKGGTSAAVATTVGTATTAAVASTLAAVSAPAWAPVAVGFAAATAAASVVSSVCDFFFGD